MSSNSSGSTSSPEGQQPAATTPKSPLPDSESLPQQDSELMHIKIESMKMAGFGAVVSERAFGRPAVGCDAGPSHCVGDSTRDPVVHNPRR